MSNRYVIEALLRPAVELNTAVVSGIAAYVCVQAPGLSLWLRLSAMSPQPGLRRWPSPARIRG